MGKPLKKLGDGELDVMLAVWDMWKDGNPVTSSDVMERLAEKRSWAITTLMTVLARLVEKGYLSCDRSTRTNLYSPLVAEQEYKEQESQTFLKRMYHGSLPGLVSSLYQSGAVNDEDLEELRRFIENAGKEGS